MPATDAQSLAEKIVESILKDPASAAQHAERLAQTFNDLTQRHSKDSGQSEAVTEVEIEEAKSILTSKPSGGLL